MTVYEDVVKTWNQERATKDLLPVKAGFFKDVAAYNRRLREAYRNLDQKSLKAIVIQDELSRLQTLVSDLVYLRLEKMWEAARAKSLAQPDALERHTYDSFSEIASYYRGFKEDLSQGKEPQTTQASKKERLTVRFLRDVPSIVGIDLRTYGPFLREDVAIMPFENAETLIRQGAATEIAGVADRVSGDNG